MKVFHAIELILVFWIKGVVDFKGRFSNKTKIGNSLLDTLAAILFNQQECCCDTEF